MFKIKYSSAIVDLCRCRSFSKCLATHWCHRRATPDWSRSNRNAQINQSTIKSQSSTKMEKLKSGAKWISLTAIWPTVSSDFFLFLIAFDWSEFDRETVIVSVWFFSKRSNTTDSAAVELCPKSILRLQLWGEYISSALLLACTGVAAATAVSGAYWWMANCSSGQVLQ